MAYPKGKPRPPNSGRKKGSINKLTADVKEMVLAALDKAGGADYLFAQAADNPTAFMTLVGKVLPLQIGNVPGEEFKPKPPYPMMINP